jgi:hypothetical protein
MMIRDKGGWTSSGSRPIRALAWAPLKVTYDVPRPPEGILESP